MKQYMNAGIIAGAVAVTAGGGVGVVAGGWPEGVLVALAVAGAHPGRAIILRGGRGLLPGL